MLCDGGARDEKKVQSVVIRGNAFGNVDGLRLESQICGVDVCRCQELRCHAKSQEKKVRDDGGDKAEKGGVRHDDEAVSIRC